MILGPRLAVFGAALGFCIVVTIIILSRASVMEAGLFLPIVGAAFLALSYAVAFTLRKGRFIALGADGRGEIPVLPHLFAKRQARRFELGATRTRYDLPYLYFEPPLQTGEGPPVDRLFIHGRHVKGGYGRIDAFVDFANSISTAEPEGLQT